MTYCTYVISLVDELNRRNSISCQLKSINESFQFVDAIDFRRSQHDLVDSSVRHGSSNTIKRTMTKGEVGCALSHFECYQKLVSSNADWAWIIEDDASLLDRIKEGDIRKILSEIEGADIDVLILGYSKLSKEEEHSFYKMEPIKAIKKIDSTEIGTPWKNWTCGTVSYIISRSGAEKFLKNFKDKKIATVADDWHYFQENFSIKILHCRPVLVFEDFISFESSLEAERRLVDKKKINFLDGIRVLRGMVRKLIMKSW